MSEKYEIVNGKYTVLSKSGNPIEFTTEQHKDLLLDYCVKKATIENICLKYKVGRSDLERYRRAIGFTRESIPVTDEEVVNYSVEELANLIVDRKAKALELAQDYYVERITKDATNWQKFQEGTLKPFEALKNELIKNSKVVPKVKSANSNSGLLLECAIFDAHIGKLSNFSEVGTDYNLEIASKLYSDAVDFSINSTKGYKIQKIVLPIGQDFLHVDNKNNETTAGTRQDVAGMWFEIFVVARKLLVETIEKLKRIAPVEVIVVSGNHETCSMFHLGDCIECRYWNDENVIVNNTPTPRKYYQWGKNLIGYAHGDKTKVGDLAVLMATESADKWATTNYRYWRLGHQHHQKMYVDEQSGVIMEVLPSISATDSWHAGQGYTQCVRGAVSSLFDEKKGLIGKFYFNI